MMLMTMVMLGVSLAFGSLLSGLLTTRGGPKCTIARQYLYQMTSCGCGMMLTLFTVVEGFNATLMFVCCYGLLCGGLQYSLKVYILEVVGRQLADGAWGAVAMAQAVPTLLGTPIVGNEHIFYSRSMWKFRTTAIIKSLIAISRLLVAYGIFQ